MIVRIATEGQYQIGSSLLEKLDELDDRLVQMVTAGDQSAFKGVLTEMLTLVRSQGQPVPTEELVASDLILPAPDTTLDEAKTLFVGEGLIPG